MNKVSVIEIATGKHRRETNWKNRKLAWPTLVERLAKPHRTHETVKEYWAATKEKRDQIKDIGGFVGGYMAGRRRKSGAVLYRTLITLDVDEADPSFWYAYQLLYDNAALIYSTHSHTPEKPRYRLVMPCSRHVEPDEYQPLARRIAGCLGIEQFDNTGFQDERLMYWPSCSADGEYVFHHQDGPAIDVDQVLSSYTDWRNASEWPVSERAQDMIKRSQKKQGDPLVKKGIVGAFCRTYSISGAIDKYLNDVYEKTDDPNRYTYTGGSTAAGLILYDDCFAYSHHGTDPISGKLCNSFDLVRLHLFGEQDLEIDKETPPDDRPSYQAMKGLAASDEDIRQQIGVERLEAAKEDFAAVGIDTTEVDTDWMKQLQVDERSNYKHTIDNIVLILENDPMLAGCIGYDEFSYTKVVMKSLPWRKGNEDSTWGDNDEANLRWYLEKIYNITGQQKVQDGIEVVLKKNTFHPVRDYLNGLVWDNVERIDGLLINYFSADDTEYTRTVVRKTLVAAVARVFDPGCKFDTMLVLKGKQGLRKSMFIDILGGEWYSDSFGTVTGKEAYEQLQGAWIIEPAELSAMRKAEVDQVKHFLSKRKDKYRPVYGRNPVTRLRQCILIGTSNRDALFNDSSGARRFWPVECNRKLTDRERAKLKSEKDLIWAEAVHLYKAGETVWLNPELEKDAIDVQSQHTETDDREGLILEYLDKLIPENWDSMTIWQKREFYNNEEMSAEGTIQRLTITALEIYAELLGGPIKDFDLRKARELNDIMKKIPGWEYRVFKKGGKTFRGFVRISVSGTREKSNLYLN